MSYTATALTLKLLSTTIVLLPKSSRFVFALDDFLSTKCDHIFNIIIVIDFPNALDVKTYLVTASPSVMTRHIAAIPLEFR